MAEDDGRHVVVTDIRMPFLSMVVFLVKLAIAAIPAMLILSLVGALVTALVGLLTGGMMGGFVDGPGGMRRF